MAPEFAEFLQRTAGHLRVGRVFLPKAQRKHFDSGMSGWKHVSVVICKIGKRVGVKVDTDPRTGRVKYASAHDLRRSFGERWASRVMPQVLMELMRHEDIQTTMKYYVGRNAERTAKMLWDAHMKASSSGNTRGNSESKPLNSPESDVSTSASHY